MAIYKFFLGMKERGYGKAYLFMSNVKPIHNMYPNFKYVVGPFKAPEDAVKYTIGNKLMVKVEPSVEHAEALRGALHSMGMDKNPKIPQEVLEFRERVPKGSIMKSETFRAIEKKTKRKGYRKPRAVAGKAYWTTLKAKYRKALQDHVVGSLQRGKPTLNIVEDIVRITKGGLTLRQANQFVKEVYNELYSGKPMKNFDPTSFATLAGASAIGTMVGKKLLGNPSGKRRRQPIKFRGKWYIGCDKKDDSLITFFSNKRKITKKAFPMYSWVSGPFKSRGLADAWVMEKEGIPLSNPPAGAVRIYDNILAIEAKKGQESLWPEENFRHDFKARKGKAAVFGMPDGSLLVKGKKRLWKKFKYGKGDI